MTNLRGIVEGLKAEERQVEENLEGIRKATIAEMRVIILCFMKTLLC